MKSNTLSEYFDSLLEEYQAQASQTLNDKFSAHHYICELYCKVLAWQDVTY